MLRFRFLLSPFAYAAEERREEQHRLIQWKGWKGERAKGSNAPCDPYYLPLNTCLFLRLTKEFLEYLANLALETPNSPFSLKYDQFN